MTFQIALPGSYPRKPHLSFSTPENYLKKSKFYYLMIGKKRCGNCGEKVEDSYNYCPYCQAPLKDLFEEGDWGLLGRNDFVEPGEIKLPMGLNTLFNSLLKNLNKQMKDIDQEKENQSKEQKG